MRNVKHIVVLDLLVHTLNEELPCLPQPFVVCRCVCVLLLSCVVVGSS